MTEKKHILFIHQFATTYDEPGEIRHIEMFKSLKDKGIRVTVISGSVNYQTGVHYPDFKGFSQEKELAGISRSFIAFYRIYCAPTYRKGFIGRILNYISFLITSFIFSLSIKNVDIVLATSPSLFTGLAGWFISLFRSRPFFFEMRDLWPKVAVEMGLLKNKSLIDIAYWLEKFLCLKAVRNIVITEGYAGYIESIGINRNKIAIVENGVDSWMVEHKITHDDCPGIIEKIKDKFLVMYVGAIGKFNYLDEMLKADLKISRRDDIHFVFVGDGGERKALEEYASNEKLSNVHFTGSVSKEIIPSYLQLAGVCF